MRTLSLSTRAGRVLAGLLAALALALLAAAWSPSRADAELISSFTASSSSAQAGDYVDFTTTFTVGGDMFDLERQRPKNLRFQLPAGLLGTISNFDTCDASRAWARTCPETAAVGRATSEVITNPGFPQQSVVYNLTPVGKDVATLGLPLQESSGVVVAMVVVHLRARPDDYGLTATINNLPGITWATTMTLYGHPHDHFPGATEGKTFMHNPFVCGQPQTTTLEVNSYEDPDTWETYTSTMPALTGCDQLSFDPSIWVRGDNPFVGEGSSFEFGISVPQNTDPAGLATPPLSKVTAVLPEGLSINPSVANGAVACSDGAFGMGSMDASSCPAASRIGTVGFQVPPLPDPHMQGAIYLAEPKPGEQFRVFLEAYSSNTRVKLKGSILPDAKTGRLTAIFDGNPQVPVSAIKLAFKGGARSVLAMPDTCGIKPVVAAIDSWSGQTARPQTSLQVGFDAQGTPCPEKLGFAPNFAAGTVNDHAGQDAGFTMVFGRADKDQALSRIDLSMPAGLLGRLTAVPLCPAAKAANGTCGDESLVGDSRVWAGAGSSPFEVQGGKVFLTEPYREGDVAGLSIVVRALAGPYDLGTAVVRAGIKVRPDTSLEVAAEALPTIMEGVPLRIRRVQVDLGRPGFMFNPSDCSPKKITGTITSADGATSDVSSPFQVTGCSKLDFSPSMSIKATKPAADRTLGLDVTVNQDRGEARMRRLSLVLPSGMGSRLDGPIQAACSEEDYEHDRCADAARIGTATATTEVLPYGLDAPVYFVANPNGGLPRLGVRLRGGPIRFDLLGEVEINQGGRIVTVFDGIPDVPISSFRLQLADGSQAVLTGTDMCADKRASLEVIAHSGAVSRQKVAVETAGCTNRRTKTAKAKKAKKATTARHARR
jgi:hypothetical protein